MKRKADTSFYRKFLTIYVALVLQNVVTLSVNLADNMMLGSYSETALSGVAAVNQIQFIYQQLLMALGDGLVIFCSQYWGKRQTEPMKKISATAMHAGLLIAILLFALVSIFPRQAVGIFTTEESIIREGVSYLSIIRFTYLFFAVTQILLATLRSVGGGENRLLPFGDDVFCQLRNQLRADIRPFRCAGNGGRGCGDRDAGGAYDGACSTDYLHYQKGKAAASEHSQLSAA